MLHKLKSPLAVIFVTLLLDKLGENIVYPLLPFILAAYSPDGLTLGLLAATATLFSVVATPLIGTLSDSFGRRRVILFCIAINVFSLLLFGFAGSLSLIFLSRAINGVATATVGTAQAYISDISTPATRARNFGISGAAFGLGAIAGPAMGGGLVGLGIHVPLFAAAGLAFVNFVMALLYLHESLPMERRLPFKMSGLNIFAQLQLLLRRPRVNSLALSFSCFNFAFSAFTSLLVLNLKDALGWSASQSGGIFVIVGITVTYVQVALIGKLVHRHGELNLNRAGLLIVALGIGLLPLASGIKALGAVIVVISALLLSVGAALVIPTARSLVSSSVSDTEQGVMLGSLLSLTGIASALGPVSAGLLYDRSPSVSFLLQALVCVVGVVLLKGVSVARPQS
jgi:DHA1 family tetracycline resistance protein-like MFS transporter